MVGNLGLGLLVTCLVISHVATAGIPAAGVDAAQTGQPAPRAAFGAETASKDAHIVADWVIGSGNNEDMPFVIIDKIGAKVFVFDVDGLLRGAAPVLLGLTRGDKSPPGIGTRKLANITPKERITPSGRFVAALGHDLGKQDILWVDYENAISLHRVINSKASERRLQRLMTASARDNRISYGCINVPVKFYEAVIRTTFNATSGVVYILPEMASIYEVFPVPRRAKM